MMTIVFSERPAGLLWVGAACVLRRRPGVVERSACRSSKLALSKHLRLLDTVSMIVFPARATAQCPSGLSENALSLHSLHSSIQKRKPTKCWNHNSDMKQYSRRAFTVSFTVFWAPTTTLRTTANYGTESLHLHLLSRLTACIGAAVNRSSGWVKAPVAPYRLQGPTL